MVGYVLLLVITIGLVIAVFAYLKVFIPKDKPECRESISLSIQQSSCIDKKLSLVLLNTGLFKIEGVYIRLGNESQKVRQQVNNIAYIINNTFLGLMPESTFTTPLYDVSTIVKFPGTYSLEVEPAELYGKNLALCDKAIVVDTVYCD